MEDRRPTASTITPSSHVNDVQIGLSPHELKGPNVIAVGAGGIGNDERRRSILAPTNTQLWTKRQQKPGCSLDPLLWLPFNLVKWVLISVVVIVWFLLSVVFGILLLPISPRWIFRFFRDLCNLSMSEDEKIAVEIEIVEIARQNIKDSKLPGCPIHPHKFPHAVAMGRFQVEEGLSSDLRVGLFSRVNSYDAVVRFSGASGPPDEYDDGIHGLAVKVCGVDESLGSSYMMWDDIAVRDEKEQGIPGERYDNKTVSCDFISVTAGPTFFAKNMREVLWVTKTQRSSWFGLYLPAIRVLWRLIVTQPKINKFLNENRGPLGWTYCGWVPYRLGQHIVKYHWLPDQIGAWQMPLRKVQYPCKKSISDHLVQQSASYGLYVQFQPLPSDPNYDKFPIEDASVEWDQKISPLHRVATLTLPPQVIDTPQRWYMSHTLSYNPAQTFAEHAPVGTVNTSRHRIYHVSAMERMKRLGLKSVPKCPFLAAQENEQLPYGEMLPQVIATATNVYCAAEKEVPQIKITKLADDDNKTKGDDQNTTRNNDGASSDAVLTKTETATEVPASPNPPAPAFAPRPPSPEKGNKVHPSPTIAPAVPAGNGVSPGRVSVTRGGATTVTPPSPALSSAPTAVQVSATHFRLAPAPSNAGVSGSPNGTSGPRTAVVYLEE